MGWYSLFGVIIPYAAVFAFIVGFIYRVLKWASSPVPFHIPTVCGQQKSLPWIKTDSIDSPHTTGGIVPDWPLKSCSFVRFSRMRPSSSRDLRNCCTGPACFCGWGGWPFTGPSS